MIDQRRPRLRLPLHRRDVLCGAGAAAAGAVLAACGGGKPQDPCSSSIFVCDADMKMQDPNTFVVPDIDKIPVGQVLVVAAEQAFIQRTADGYAAVRDRCTHSGCGVFLQADNKSYLCACHGSRFNTDGTVINGPAARQLDWYIASRTGNELHVSRINLQKQRERIK